MSATKEKLHDVIEKGMKRTAVEWLKPQIELMSMDGHKSYPNELEEVFEIAKEMEKQQQGYSEEEVINFLQEMNDWPTTFEERIDIREWFEEFKNK
jgi:hypothetical protein